MRRTDQSSARIVEEPRPLTEAESKIICAVLDYADFDGRDALLAQISSTRVVARCGCGCATVDLRVGDPIEGQPISAPIPNEAGVLDGDGRPIGGLMIFVADGRLSMLEIYSNGDEPISLPLSRRSIFTSGTHLPHQIMNLTGSAMPEIQGWPRVVAHLDMEISRSRTRTDNCEIVRFATYPLGRGCANCPSP